MEIVCEIETNESNIMLILKQTHGELIVLCQNTSSETFFILKKVFAISRLNLYLKLIP